MMMKMMHGVYVMILMMMHGVKMMMMMHGVYDDDGDAWCI